MKVEAQTLFSSACEATQWDPEAILGITNPDRGTFTCVGYAPSMRRRCRNPIARNNRDVVYGLLEILALTGPSSRMFAGLLEKAAYRSLCWRHGNQVDDIVEKWEAIIIALDLPAPKAKGKGKQSNSHAKESQSTGSYYTRYTDEYIKTEEEEDLKWKEREQDRREAQQNQQRKKRQEEEQEKEKKQQERRDREARERRQQETQKRRGEREQQAREQAMKERRDWQQAWQGYVTKWAAFEESKHEPRTAQQAQALIPWPVKSGRFGDLTSGHVESFYREACPDAKTAAMFKTMRRESLKWHPDKMCNLYRNCASGLADKMAIEMICRIVLKLREEAKAMR